MCLSWSNPAGQPTQQCIKPSVRSAALKKVFLGELVPHKKLLGQKRDNLLKTIDSVKVGWVAY